MNFYFLLVFISSVNKLQVWIAKLCKYFRNFCLVGEKLESYKDYKKNRLKVVMNFDKLIC